MTEIPPVGALLVDTTRDAIGEFRDKMGIRFYLRPIGGGREWSVSPEYVRPATPAERRQVVRNGR
jgi:hypothetical protein